MSSSSPTRIDPRAGGGVAVATVIVWAVVSLRLGLGEHAALARGFGDSDDATRLAMVRSLIGGDAWYPRAFQRLQPPLGAPMHWSRLLDGALALADGGLGAALGPARGEWALRLLWPLVLIGPALLAAMSLTARLAGAAAARPALWAAGAACAVALPLYAQFHPGRLDHHNVQIVLWLAALAGAASESAGGALLAGAASGLGLAVGLEALALHAAVGATLAARFALAAQRDAGAAIRLRAYGLALLGVTAAAFLAQTPPARWGAPACDALGLNLVGGVLAGGAGLAAASFARGREARLLSVAGAGLAAAGVYLAFDPACLRGPFAHMNPALRGVWLDNVQEVRPLPAELRADPATGATILAALLAGPLAWAACGFDRKRRVGLPFALMGASLAVAAAAAFAMLRMSSYLFWAAVPPVATAAALLAVRLSRGGAPDPVRTALLGLALSPVVLAAPAVAALRWARPAAASLASGPAPARPDDRCFEAAAYAGLARLPVGRVLAEPDLGPFVIVSTPHSAIAAPYHRLDAGILGAHAAFTAPVAAAEARVRTLGADYVVACPAHDGALPAPPGSLRADLARGVPPAWLLTASPPGATLQVWRVAFPGAAPAPMHRP